MAGIESTSTASPPFMHCSVSCHQKGANAKQGRMDDHVPFARHQCLSSSSIEIIFFLQIILVIGHHHIRCSILKFTATSPSLTYVSAYS